MKYYNCPENVIFTHKEGKSGVSIRPRKWTRRVWDSGVWKAERGGSTCCAVPRRVAKEARSKMDRAKRREWYYESTSKQMKIEIWIESLS